MRCEPLPEELTRQVPPATMQQYVRGLGWPQVAGIESPRIAVYHHPNDPQHQIILPADQGLVDYGEALARAICRLADFAHRLPRELLDQLLLAPADLLRFEPAHSGPVTPFLPLGYAATLLDGARQALLAVAQSVLDPQPFHARLDRREARQVVDACRLGQPHRPDPVVVLACPHAAAPTEASLLDGQVPFARRVVLGLMETLAQLAEAGRQRSGDRLLQPAEAPLLSANLCEAIVAVRPPEDLASLTVSAAWWVSGTGPAPLSASVLLGPESFALAEYLAPRLRATRQPLPGWYVGFVEKLQGSPGPAAGPQGEVQVNIAQGEEVLPARLDLAAEEYALASTAHLNNTPVYFRGVLYRSAGIHRVEQVGPFLLVQRPTLAQAS
jgi:hypothetical protein